MSSRPPAKGGKAGQIGAAPTRVGNGGNAKSAGVNLRSPAPKGSSPEAIGTKKSLTPWLLLALALIALDQVTKFWVTAQIDKGAVIEITSFFNLVHVLNPGAAFSFLASESGWQRHFLSIVAVVASAVILWMMHTSRDRAFNLLCLTGILSGAIGNLIDRVSIGAVIDFLDFYYQHYHWPAFNVADICISLGAIGLIFSELFMYKDAKQAK